MKTIIKSQHWKILEIFYQNKNHPIHLREISRKIKLKEGPLSRHLKALETILTHEKEGNLKKFKIKEISKIYPFFDIERFNNLIKLRQNSIEFYLNHLEEKPIFLILFGSTATLNFKEDSDIDIIAVFNKKTQTTKSRKYSESQTGIKINEFQLTYFNFLEEIKLKQDNVIQSGIETGYPIYNHEFYYKTINNERKNTQQDFKR